MRRYEQRFAELRKNKKRAFVPFTLLGWPDRATSFKLIKQMIECGASALELGIAFSDPVADGPIIQKAAYDTIASGFSVSDALGLLADIRKLDNSIPIGILVYFNTILAKGVDAFFAQLKAAQVDGVLIADLPPESAEEVLPVANANGIDLIFLVSPVTTPARLSLILSEAKGFLYLVSRLGVTGTVDRSAEKDRALRNLVTEIKSRSNIPICAGFGISSKNDALNMFEIDVDGIISGSRIIQLVGSQSSTREKELKQYYEEMISACGHPVRLEQTT